MSYILDALKKAEAERHIGQIPGLHVQPAAALPTPAAPKHNNKVLLLIIAAIALGAGGVLAWLQPWQSAPTQSGPAAVAQQTLVPAGAPLTPPVAAPAPAPQIVAVSPPPEPPKPVARKEPKPRPAATPRRPDTPKAATAAVKPTPRATQTASTARPTPANDLKLSTALTPEVGVSSPGELPAQIQRELPALAIGGYIYSDNPRERQLLVNKRLLHEGAEAAPGVKLEKMLPNAAVFNYKGYRYRLAY